MTQLEQTIIERARGYLSLVCAFYDKGDSADEHDRDDFQSNHSGLTALLEFGHLADCGMSPEGQAELLAIEAEAAEAQPLQNGVYWYLGVTRPCSKCRTGLVTMAVPDQLRICPACIEKI